MRSNPSPPPLKFGERGELTLETINQAGLTPAERERALEMLDAQHAYLQIIDTIGGSVLDPDGNVYDLGVMLPAVWAAAWTLALAGARFTGPAYIKKRQIVGGGETWVDVREPDEPIVLPEAPVEPMWDGVRPTVTVVNEPRPNWMN